MHSTVTDISIVHVTPNLKSAIRFEARFPYIFAIVNLQLVQTGFNIIRTERMRRTL